MRINLNNFWGPIAVLMSGTALYLAIFNARTTEVIQQPPSTSPGVQNTTASGESRMFVNQLQEINASLEQNRKLLVELQTRQLKLEKFTKNSLRVAENPEESLPQGQSIAATPSDVSFDNEALNRRDQQLNYLEDVLYDQELDPNWSSEMSNKISGALSVLPGNLADSSYVQCQSTLCMLEVSISQDEIDDFILQFNTQIADATQQMRSFVHNRGDGKLTMQMYLTKVGHDLPQSTPSQSIP